MVKKILIVLFLVSLACNSVYGAYVANDPQSKMTSAIINYLVTKDPSYAGKKIDVTYKYAEKVFRDLKYRKGKIAFSIAELYPDFMPIGNIIIPVQVIEDDVQKEKIFLRAKVSIFDRIVVAKKRLQRGDVISSNEAGMEERDIAVLNPDIIRDYGLAYGKEVKTFVPLGNPVYGWMIKEKPMVKKNEKVKIISGTDSIVVSADGVALGDGDMGAEVKVKNADSEKELIGVVTGTGEVTVK
jgi:flagella basal body P-ring formation protein FlgA